MVIARRLAVVVLVSAAVRPLGARELAAGPRAPRSRAACEMTARAGDAIIYKTTYLVDSSGRLAAEEVRQRGALTGRVTYRRDAKNRVVEKCQFSEPGGHADGCARLRYRGAGRQPFESDDVGSDREVAARYRYEYDAGGREIRRTIDRHVDGKIDVVQTTRHDAKGRIERIDIEDIGGGTSPPDRTVIRFVHAPGGGLIERNIGDEKGAVILQGRFTAPCMIDLRDAQ
jgi:hypothetical protein